MTRAARHVGRTDLLRVVAVGRSPEELPYAAELTEAGATVAYTRHGEGDRPPGPPTVDEVRPLRVEQPQRTPAAGAEVALARTCPAAAVVVADPGLVHTQVFAAFNLEGVGVRAQVDRAAAAARRLSADRAVAVQERHGRVGLALEADVSAVA
jgi:hypothetical protein